MKKRALAILFASLLAISLTACGSNTEPAEDTETETTTKTEQQEETPAASDTATVGDFEVSIGDAAIVTDDFTGEEALLVNFQFTNNSDENASALINLLSQAFQDGVQLEAAIISSEDFDSGSESLEVQPGGTHDFQRVFTMTRDSPVEVTIEEFLGDGTQAVKEFNPAELA